MGPQCGPGPSFPVLTGFQPVLLGVIEMGYRRARVVFTCRRAVFAQKRAVELGPVHQLHMLQVFRDRLDGVHQVREHPHIDRDFGRNIRIGTVGGEEHMGDRGQARKRGPGGVRVVQVDRKEPRRGFEIRRTARQRNHGPVRVIRKMLDKRPPGDTERADNQGTVLGHGLETFLTDRPGAYLRAPKRSAFARKNHLDIYLIYQLCFSMGASRRPAMGVKPAQSLTDQAYTTLEELIVTLQIAPGQAISEGELCEQTGFGRTPVREALQRLAQQHLVSIFPRRGMFVTEINVETQLQLLELRREIERLMVRLAARRRTEAEHLQFAEIAAAMEEAAETSDDERFMVLDNVFNTLVGTTCRNAFAQTSMEQWNPLSRRFWYPPPHTCGGPSQDGSPPRRHCLGDRCRG